MRSTFYPVLLTLTIAVFGLGFATAQGDRGTITGTVKDSSGAVLPGARVELQQKGPSAVSDGQGQFIISNLAPGSYTLTVSYVGFSPFSTTATVLAGQISHVDAALQVETASQVVTVSGDRELGEVEAINIERTADNIVQVLPSQVITSLPNTNIADAVGRLPSVSLERDEGEGKYVQIRGTEPRLSNVTVDGVNLPSPEGNVRNIKLDVIPSGLVDRIEVNKTLSANQDGDAIGGSVNLVTKTPGERPTLDFEGQGGYTNIIGGRWLDAFNGTVGQRLGARKQWGLLLGSSYDWNGRGINDLEPGPTTISDSVGNNYAYFPTADLRTYKYYRTRYGFAPELDYAIKPGSSIYFKGLYSDFHDYGDTWVYTPTVGNTLKSVNGAELTFDNATDCQTINQAADLANPDSNPCQPGKMKYRHYIRRPDQQIFSGLTGGRHDLTSTLITYEFAVSRAHNIGGQDFSTASFAGPAPSFSPTGATITPGVDFAANSGRLYEPQFPVQDGTNIYNPATYSLSSYTIPNYSSTQLNLQGAASLARRYSVHDHYGTLEFGIKVRNAHKTQFENDFIYDSPSVNIPLNGVLGSFTNPTYYDGAYKFGPMSDYGKIIQQANANLSNLGYNLSASRVQSDPANFDATERVYAGYVMNTIGFDRLTIQTGVRIEATDDTYRANQINLSSGSWVSTTPINGSGSYINVLPSIQLQYRIQQNTNLRGTFGMGISRPNFSDIVPSKQLDPNFTPPTEVVGNPALKPTRANNYDILAEHYFRPYGILQAGFFYKTLTNPIYPTTTLLPGGPGTPFPTAASYDLAQSINGPTGHIAGIEAAWEQRLSFLPGFLSGFGVSANYSYSTSQVSFPTGFNGGRTDHPALPRQAPNNWNLGFTYDKARFSMRFAVSHNDTSIFSYFWVNNGTPKDPVTGLKGPNGDQYLYAHTQYDIQGSYRLYRGLSVVAYGLNLSNEPFGFYQGSTPYPIQREFYHPTASVGFRWTSGGE
jgi:TonB-dependent receptor